MLITARTVLEAGLYTVPEVAYAVDVEDKAVNREIDAKIICTAGQSSSGERLLDKYGLLYMAAIHELRTDLSKKLRVKIAENIRSGTKILLLGPFELPVWKLSALVNARLSDIDTLRSAVTSDPNICGGDPVIRDTRMCIHKIAALVEQGTTLSEFATEFDISADQVKLAVIFSRLHPKRGRREVQRRDVMKHVSSRR